MARLLTKRLNNKKGRIKRITVSQKIKKSETIIKVFIFVSIFTMSLIYVFQINNIATKSYEIENYEKKLLSIKKDNQKMMIELADLKSINNLESKFDKFRPISLKDITYITTSQSAVAMER